MLLLVNGHASTEQLCAVTGLHAGTVKRYFANLFSEFELFNRVELALMVVRCPGLEEKLREEEADLYRLYTGPEKVA